MKSRLHQRVTTARPQNVPFTPSKLKPDVFFSTAARSSFGPESFTKNVTFANALKSGLEPPASNIPFSQATHLEPNTAKQYQPTEQQQSNSDAILFNLQQSLMDFMAFMRTTMQDLMRNQNLLIQMLLSQQAK